MCGIAGVFGRRDPETVDKMLSMLVHRGPDDRHRVDGEGFALGATRLAIQDVEHGRQPLSNERGTVWAAQNGELYNAPTARRALAERGHILRTRCDTEVLPHLFEDHGVDLPVQVDGMFAIAVWDAASRTGLLARDRLGKKPLYTLQLDDALYFASEIKALLVVPGFSRRLNLRALHHYLSVKHVPSPLSIFEGISMLPPAHRLVFRRDAPVRVERFWKLSFAPATGSGAPSESEAVDELLRLLDHAINRRLVSDVPVGFFLSGGLDSSLVVALAAQRSERPLETFTLTYAAGSTTSGKEEDRRWARHVATRWQTQHHEETIAALDYPTHLRTVIGCMDEPFAGVTSTYALSQAMARHVKVAISGDGADELFGSYLSHRLALPMSRFAEFERTKDPALIRPFEAQLGLLSSLAAPEVWQWRSNLLVFTEAQKAALYARDLRREMTPFSTADELRAVFQAGTATDPINVVLEAELHTFLPDQVLAFVDRLSMAHSLEIRSPYLDTALVTFLAGLPGALKMGEATTKALLKSACARFFPPEMVHRPKEGFLMPVARWLVELHQSYVRDTLSPSRLAQHGLFDVGEVTRLVEAMNAPGADHTDANRVIALLAFQEWYDLYLR
ncbi:MAG: asparagine synthase (glutamine-hydrolyzing) [Deltaproteobacteria bacterium]|nr:asparagine synthase (glutamine-hydrolyzing) [Deltaproteobacteria bacterium]